MGRAAGRGSASELSRQAALRGARLRPPPPGLRPEERGAPVGLVPSRTCRAVPYLYSDEEIVALMEAARSLTPALRGATYETLIGLLRATGMRVGEAIRLDRNEVCFDEGVLVVWKSKFAKSRELALHESRG